MMENENRIGLGTAAIGRPTYINIRKDVDTRSAFSLDNFKRDGIDLLENAYVSGIRYFDTAPGYGMAEELLLEWASKKNDPSIEIATKWGYTYVAGFDPDAKVHELKEHSIDKLNEQWSQSQKLLPHLRVYQIHSATFDTGVLHNKAVLDRLAHLKSEHDVIIGLSTTGANQTEVLNSSLEIAVDGSPLFDLCQVTYNIFDQSIASIAHEIDQQGRKLVIKEAMANGRVFPNMSYAHYGRSYDVLAEMAEKYQVGIDAIALRFCMDSICSYKVLSGASNNRDLLENLKANTFRLEERDIEILKSLAVNSTDYWQERQRLGWN